MNINEMMSILRNETIKTWFDLGLFIDKFKENKEVKVSEFSGEYDDFIKSLSEVTYTALRAPSMNLGCPDASKSKLWKSYLEDAADASFVEVPEEDFPITWQPA